MGREHISPWRRMRRRHDAFRRRRKGPWSRSRKLADCIIATNDAQPDGYGRPSTRSRRSSTCVPGARRTWASASLQGDRVPDGILGRHRPRPATVLAKDSVLFIGKAQEKTSVFRTEKRRDADGKRYPWIIRSTAMPNHYYVYILDRDFGPLFIKFCSYFPYAVKLCLNGHEWLKRQLTQRQVPFEPLDNGIRSSDAPARVQRIADTLDAAKIDAVFRKWLRRLPHPFAPRHRA